MITLESIQAMGSSLPGIYQDTSYGTPALKIKKKLLVRAHQSENAFVIRVASTDQQRQLIDSEPDVFYITDHYKGHAWVLVRPGIEDIGFFRLLEQAWRHFASQAEIELYDQSRMQDED